MYGLKQAAILAHENLVKNLHMYEYKHIPHILGLWKHNTRPITFCLCVDDFGIKYFNKSDAIHLLQYLQNKYTTTVDWSGNNFCRLTLYCTCHDGYVDVSIPGYVQKVLQKFQYQPPKSTQFSPFSAAPYVKAIKGQRQYAPKIDSSSFLPPCQNYKGAKNCHKFALLC